MLASTSYEHADHQGNDFDIILGILTLNFHISLNAENLLTSFWG